MFHRDQRIWFSPWISIKDTHSRYLIIHVYYNCSYQRSLTLEFGKITMFGPKRRLYFIVKEKKICSRLVCFYIFMINKISRFLVFFKMGIEWLGEQGGWVLGRMHPVPLIHLLTQLSLSLSLIPLFFLALLSNSPCGLGWESKRGQRVGWERVEHERG